MSGVPEARTVFHDSSILNTLQKQMLPAALESFFRSDKLTVEMAYLVSTKLSKTIERTALE